MELNRDFSEFIAPCVAHDVRFMIVGGYAVAAYGHPRFTKDLDVWVWVDEQNANCLLALLAHSRRLPRGRHGRPARLPADTHRHHHSAQVEGVKFDPCWERHIEVEMAGQDVPFISVEDLLTNKEASSRPHALADAVAIEQLFDGGDHPSTP